MPASVNFLLNNGCGESLISKLCRLLEPSNN